jgi:hypothetical protein
MAFAAQLAAQFGRNHEYIAPDLRVYVTDEMGREVFTMAVRDYARASLTDPHIGPNPSHEPKNSLRSD